LKSLIKKAGIRLLSRPPVSSALRSYTLRGNPLTILCYHTLRPASEQLEAWTVLGLADFHAQMDYLEKHYQIVSLEDGLQQRGQAGRPRVVLSFDDGEWGLYQYLLPIIKERGMPVTVYVATRQIATGSPYWFDRVMNALQVAKPAVIELNIPDRRVFHINAEDSKTRWNQINAILEAIKTQREEERDGLADQTVAQAGPQTTGFDSLQPMTLPQLKSLASHPLVTIGAHSHGHELLDNIPLEMAGASISQSKNWLEDETGQSITHFAYPNGNFSPELMAQLSRLGFATATILGESLAHPHDDMLALPRIGIGRYDTIGQFKVSLMGLR